MKKSGSFICFSLFFAFTRIFLKCCCDGEIQLIQEFLVALIEFDDVSWGCGGLPDLAGQGRLWRLQVPLLQQPQYPSDLRRRGKSSFISDHRSSSSANDVLARRQIVPKTWSGRWKLHRQWTQECHRRRHYTSENLPRGGRAFPCSSSL